MRLDDETKRLLKSVVDHFDNEDAAVREAQLRHYRRLKLYWNSFNQIYWSETARDYRIAASQDLASSDSDQDYYDKPVNVFRAFLETIIAALSIQVPATTCVPDDAENPNDISTAKTGDKIAELLYKQNDAIWLWLHSLYIHMTEGMVACYTYPDEDKKYGTYKEKKYKDEEIESFICPHCQAQFEEAVMTGQLDLFNQDPQVQQQMEIERTMKNQAAEQFALTEENAFGPDDEDVMLHNVLNQGPVCPECGMLLDPNMQKTKLTIPRFVGMNEKAKSRICMKMFGGLYIKTANYAMEQCDTPYLIYSYETHYANVLQQYGHLREELPRGGWANVGIGDPYQQYARLNPQYRNSFPEEQVTVKNVWLRPAAFNILNEDDCDKLQRKFPDGCKVVMVNDLVADGCNEALDDCWTLTKNPLHDYLNHDAYGELIVNIQDIVNDLISLTLQTIEHGIAQTWADPAVVNFEAQGQIEAQPGTISPTKPQGGARSLAEAFHSTQLARLSPEVFQFYQVVQQLGQFVSAAMPSIFGGSQEAGSSRTASEYAMSRTASLQRLQTTWRMFTIWWKEIFGKAIPAYMNLIKEDERFVTRDQQNNFINIWLRKSEMMGKIGSVELDTSEQLPVSDEQKSNWIMKLMELNNQEIMAALTSPENLPFILKVSKIPEFKLPGEADRQKQLEEIQILSTSEPIVVPLEQVDPMQAQLLMEQGQQPQPIEKSSVEVDPIVDNHQLEAAICRSWLVGEAGRLAKVENPAGYKNVLLHMKEHNEVMQQQMMAQMQQQIQMQAMTAQATNPNFRKDDAGPNKGQNPEGNSGNQPAKPKKKTTIEEFGDARAPVQ